MNMRTSVKWRLGIAVVAFSLFCGGANAFAASLPPKARAALEKAFPGARIGGSGREKEFGALFYEAKVKYNGKSMEVEVSPDGVIGEIEYVVGKDDLSADIMKAIASRLSGKSIIKVEKHERRGSARSGTWVPLAEPKIFYDVKYRDGNRRRSLILNESGQQSRDPDDPEEGDDEEFEDIALGSLPANVSAAVRSKFSGASLTSAALESNDDGPKYYEVKFTYQKRALEVKVDESGKITEMKESLGRKQIPSVIVSALEKNYSRAKVLEVEKVLSPEATRYEVTLQAGKEKIESVLDSSGKIVRHEVEDGDDEDDDD